jgi:hypothetical protein
MGIDYPKLRMEEEEEDQSLPQLLHIMYNQPNYIFCHLRTD